MDAGPEGTGWVRTESAMAALELSRSQVNLLARQGKLTRWMARGTKGSPAWFRLEEVERLAATGNGGFGRGGGRSEKGSGRGGRRRGHGRWRRKRR